MLTEGVEGSSLLRRAGIRRFDFQNWIESSISSSQREENLVLPCTVEFIEPELTMSISSSGGPPQTITFWRYKDVFVNASMGMTMLDVATGVSAYFQKSISQNAS
jgi:hypothetical protein